MRHVGLIGTVSSTTGGTMDGSGKWTKRNDLWHRSKPLTHDKTLFDVIESMLHDRVSVRVGAIDREAGTIRLSSISVPNVVHELTLKRVS